MEQKHMEQITRELRNRNDFQIPEDEKDFAVFLLKKWQKMMQKKEELELRMEEEE